MNRIFENADFSQMTDTPVEVSEVKHKTFVEVNEKELRLLSLLLEFVQHQQCLLKNLLE